MFHGGWWRGEQNISYKGMIFASDEFELLQMVLEPSTGLCSRVESETKHLL